MAKVYAFLADGSEEVECLAAVDVLRRAGIDTKLVSIKEEKEISGSHGVRITCDETIGEADLSDADVLFLPGGMPGTIHLSECGKLMEAVKAQNAAGKRLAAICAAPSIFGMLGLLEGKKATCFPGFEEQLKGASVLQVPAVTDGTITTGRGMGAAVDFSLELLTQLQGKEAAEEMAEKIIAR